MSLQTYFHLATPERATNQTWEAPRLGMCFPVTAPMWFTPPEKNAPSVPRSPVPAGVGSSGSSEAPTGVYEALGPLHSFRSGSPPRGFARFFRQRHEYRSRNVLASTTCRCPCRRRSGTHQSADQAEGMVDVRKKYKMPIQNTSGRPRGDLPKRAKLLQACESQLGGSLCPPVQRCCWTSKVVLVTAVCIPCSA